MRHLFVNLALIGFLCRALVPVGFMPAPVADGGPIRVCHGGAAGTLLAALLEQRTSGVLGDSHSHADGHHSDRKSTRLNSSHVKISYAVFCLKKQKETK